MAREPNAGDLLAALIGLVPIMDRAESNASGNPEWDFVSQRIQTARQAIADATGVSQAIPIGETRPVRFWRRPMAMAEAMSRYDADNWGCE